MQLQELATKIGEVIATSDWIMIDQDRINQFAETTEDRQFIHVDPEAAKASPFGGTIAHGFLTLSLLPCMFESAFEIQQTRMGVNYGLNKVRFTAPVPVGSRLRGHMHLLACDNIEPQGLQMTWQVTVEREGSDKPVCVAESVVRQYA